VGAYENEVQNNLELVNLSPMVIDDIISLFFCVLL